MGSVAGSVFLIDRDVSRMSPLIDRGIPQEFRGFSDPSLVRVCVITILSSSSVVCGLWTCVYRVTGVSIDLYSP